MFHYARAWLTVNVLLAAVEEEEEGLAPVEGRAGGTLLGEFF